ncbi:unnamed protein product [Albugo candida]|uniref:Uncharacterized protein n=1 Tax=Albugo candida TaxID=65357 RepID=A0A024GKL7_9STRA|nr:unnamed protein product [Albugo candida]|eukprot:CCI47313.1 unnamed protein product [Albugo candida]
MISSILLEFEYVATYTKDGTFDSRAFSNKAILLIDLVCGLCGRAACHRPCGSASASYVYTDTGGGHFICFDARLLFYLSTSIFMQALSFWKNWRILLAS